MSFDDIVKPIETVFGFILFILASVVFLPALVIVNLLQDYWSKKIGNLFGL